MKIEVRTKIPTTQKEFDLVNQNDRPRMSDEIHGDSNRKHRRSTYDPVTKSFESYMEANEQ